MRERKFSIYFRRKPNYRRRGSDGARQNDAHLKRAEINNRSHRRRRRQGRDLHVALMKQARRRQCCNHCEDYHVIKTQTAPKIR